MSRKSRFSPEVKARILRDYRAIKNEAISTNRKHLASPTRNYGPEIRELALAYGIVPSTIATWDKEDKEHD